MKILIKFKSSKLFNTGWAGLGNFPRPYIVAEPATYRTPSKETPTPAKAERQSSAPVEDLFGEPSPPLRTSVEKPIDAEELTATATAAAAVAAEGGGDNEPVKQAQLVGDDEGEGARTGEAVTVALEHASGDVTTLAADDMKVQRDTDSGAIHVTGLVGGGSTVGSADAHVHFGEAAAGDGAAATDGATDGAEGAGGAESAAGANCRTDAADTASDGTNEGPMSPRNSTHSARSSLRSSLGLSLGSNQGDLSSLRQSTASSIHGDDESGIEAYPRLSELGPACDMAGDDVSNLPTKVRGL